MSPDDLEFLSPEAVLGGFPARRASALLFAIEGRTASLVSRDKQMATPYLTPKVIEEREKEFLEALAAGRDLPLQPTIQDIERYAPHWASLVPQDPSSRAAIAHVMAKKYRFTYHAVPKVRTTLGLEAEAVQQAYRRLFEQPIDSIYAPSVSLSEQLRWRWAQLSRRLELLPPFWTTLALTMPGAAGLLALPIALAKVGLLTGILLVVIFGLVNMVTVAALAETVSRSGISRFSLGFLGQLAQDFLGSAGSILMTVILALNNFFVLIIFYIGVSGTLQDATRLSSVVWIAALFGVCLYFLSRKSLNATVATTLLIIVVIVFTLLAIPLLALPYFRIDNLQMGTLPFIGGGAFEPSTWQLVFGIMLSTYFSHMLVATYGAVTLRRDPSARSWIRGSITAIFVFMLIACFWLLVMNGVIPSDTLATTGGTVLAPLAEKIGPIIHLLGSLLVIFSLGLASVQIALGLYYLVQERMPARPVASWLGRLSERGRFWLSVSPVVLVFLLAEWVAITGVATFTSLLGILSALSLPLLGGIFPILFLAAARRKGDFVPGVVYRLLGSPVVLVVIYLFFLATIFVHGLFLWEAPLERITALVVGLVVLAVTIMVLRGGALKPRAVVELRDDLSLNGHSVFNVTSAGQSLPAEIALIYDHGTREVCAASGSVQEFESLRAMAVKLLTESVDELKVWTHRVTPQGSSEPLPAVLVVTNGDHPGQIDLSSGAVVQPLAETPQNITITLADSTKTG